MSNYGFKISVEGKDVQTAVLSELVASTILPTWKCDLRLKNYGTIYFNISSIASGATKIIYQVPHSYNYIPSFITAWSYPAGTGGGSTSNQTFGIGDIDCTLGSGIVYGMRTDSTNFTIAAFNGSAGTLINLAGTIRFYIFADDFAY